MGKKSSSSEAKVTKDNQGDIEGTKQLQPVSSHSKEGAKVIRESEG